MGYTQCKETSNLLASLTLNNIMGEYELLDGIIRYKGRILVPPIPSIQIKIVPSLHWSPVGGHSGYQVTYHKVKNLFHWSKLKQMIKNFVAQCQVCQQAKPERVKYPGLLQPLSVPEFA